MSNAKKTVTKAAGIMMAAIFLSRISGLIREMVIAHKFGAGWRTDAYVMAFNLPDLLWFLLSIGALSGAFIPVFAEYWTNGDEDEAWKVFSIVGTFIFLVLGAIIVLCMIFTREIMPFVVRNGLKGNPEMLDLVVRLTRILLPAQLFFLIGGLIMGTLNTRQHFLAPALGPTIYNLGIIAGGMMFGDRIGIQGLAWGALAGAFLGNFLLQVIVVKRFGVKFRPSLNLRHPGVVKIGKLVLPVILGLSLPYVDVWFNRFFAGDQVKGAEAALNYANRLMQLPLGVFAQAAAVAIFPTLAILAAKKNLDEMRSSVNFGLRGLLLLTVPSSVLMIVLAKPIIVALYQHGEFTAQDTAMTIPALVLYSVGIIGWAGQGIVTRAFYALQSGFIPAISGTVITLGVFLPLCVYVTKTPLGYSGLALATSVGVLLHMLVLLEILRRRLGGLNGGLLMRSFAKVCISALISGAAAWLIVRWLGTKIDVNHQLGALIAVFAAGVPGVVVYAGMVTVLKVDEAREIGKLLTKRFKRSPRAAEAA